MSPAALRAGVADGSIRAAELEALLEAEVKGYGGELPIKVAIRREAALDSPSALACEVIDPWYAEHFERVHYEVMDDLLAPWLLGETAKFQGATYDPKQYTGLIWLGTRGMIKSVMLRMMAQWISLHRKLRLGEDARIMFCHQVLDKAIEHSVAIRTCALDNATWRETFPEFRGPVGEWDTKAKWRWPGFSAHSATEFSFTCYGETSSKIGGHYTDRMNDDWVTEDSVTTDQQLEQSFERFRQIDNLRDRTRKYNPWICMGTHYHFQDTYKRMEGLGDWLVLRMPAHTGSPKRVFDVAAIDPRGEKGKIEYAAALKRLKADPPGVLNFPNLIPWEECVRSARTQGPAGYNCQFLLNPLPDGEQRFDREALDAAWQEHIPGPEEMHVYIRIDPAISEKKKADECAIVVGGVDWRGWRWGIDGWVGREARPTEIVRKAFDFARRWQSRGYTVKNIGVESVSFQEALASIMRSGVPSREARFDGESIPMLTKPCPIRSITRSADMRKQERIMEMDGPVTRREVKFWMENPIGVRTVQQFQNFPFDRFDILDAFHDLWVDAYPPARQQGERELGMPVEFRKAIERRKKKDEHKGVLGTHNTARLASWG